MGVNFELDMVLYHSLQLFKEFREKQPPRFPQPDTIRSMSDFEIKDLIYQIFSEGLYAEIEFCRAHPNRWRPSQ